MPAAQPSRSSVSNVIGAIIAAGLKPGAVRVNADGSFCVDVADNLNQASSELPTLIRPHLGKTEYEHH